MRRGSLPRQSRTGMFPVSFHVVKGRAGSVRAVRGFSRQCLERLADYPELVLRAGRGKTVKHGRTAVVVRSRLPVDGEQCEVAIKRVRRRTWFKRFSSLFRQNHALRTFRLGHWLLERKISTARPLAVVLPFRWRTDRPTWLVTEWVDGSANLHQFVSHHAAKASGYSGSDRSSPSCFHSRVLRDAAVEVGLLIGRLHAAGAAHRDLKPGNVLVRNTSDGVQGLLVDLDGICRKSAISFGTRVQNLGRLAEWALSEPSLSPTVLLRFLHGYLSAGEDVAVAGKVSRAAGAAVLPKAGLAGDWKLFWRAIAADAARRQARRSLRPAKPVPEPEVRRAA